MGTGSQEEEVKQRRKRVPIDKKRVPFAPFASA
jgi:hypothetical protein